MGVREWVKGLFEPKLVSETIEVIPWPIGEHRTNWTPPSPQIGEFRPQPMTVGTISTAMTAPYSWTPLPELPELPEAGDMLLEGTNGDVLVADNSSNVKWESLPSAGLPRDKYSCPWCGGYTFDDYLGQCAACGGPR